MWSKVLYPNIEYVVLEFKTNLLWDKFEITSEFQNNHYYFTLEYYGNIHTIEKDGTEKEYEELFNLKGMIESLDHEYRLVSFHSDFIKYVREKFDIIGFNINNYATILNIPLDIEISDKISNGCVEKYKSKKAKRDRTKKLKMLFK